MTRFQLFFKTQKIPGSRTITLLTVLMLSIVLFSIRTDLLDFDFSIIGSFSTSFLGIIIQAFPFLLAGTIFSSIINLFVKQDFLVRFLDKSRLGSIAAPLIASIIFPVCDCSSVPVAAGFAKKGVPIRSLIIYLLTAPILNPIVILSTWYAFSMSIEILLLRIGSAIVISIITGFLIQGLWKKTSKDILLQAKDQVHASCSNGCEHHSMNNSGISGKFQDILIHASDEFIHVLPFVIAGAALSALFQTAIPHSVISGNAVTSNVFVQAIVMIGFSFALSVCSTSDAFIARGFSFHFLLGPVLGFMIAGPMIDMKNVITMTSYFKKRFILVLTLSVFIMTWITVIILSHTILPR